MQSHPSRKPVAVPTTNYVRLQAEKYVYSKLRSLKFSFVFPRPKTNNLHCVPFIMSLETAAVAECPEFYVTQHQPRDFQ